ncbi:MAG: hypothetical protein JW891_17675 [Candidatus Lokiarchaeota archaeon]|nr:hypothetical protein [Candidatus Lokiarchaeota archaeon]
MSNELNIRKWLNQIEKYRTHVHEIKKEPAIANINEENNVSQDDFKHQVEKEAYYISLNKLSVDELTWLLAERRLCIQKGYSNVSEAEIKALAEDIHKSGINRDELCWLNAELMVLHREELLV